MAGKKRIFISDLHLCARRAVTQSPPLHDYGWLNRNARHLGRFLGQLARRGDVAELVILGDLLDDWVLPASFDPGPDAGTAGGFEAILAAEQNRTVVQNLKSLAAGAGGVRVSYVPGNHDMAVAKAFLEAHFPGMRCLGQYDPGLGVYQAGGLRAEHGHRFCLFNAPDDLTGGDATLPLGYYISRCEAQDCLIDGDGADYLSVLARLIRELFGAGGDIPVAVLAAMAREAGLHANSRFRMPAGAPSPSVAEVKARFRDLMARWNASASHPEVDATQALLADAGALENAVWHVYGKTARKPRIVVCGHTHHYALFAGDRHGFVNLANAPDLEPPPGGYGFLYANAGTWIDSVKLRTYVETEEDTDAGRHHVRVMKFNSDGTSVEMLGAYTAL